MSEVAVLAKFAENSSMHTVDFTEKSEMDVYTLHRWTHRQLEDKML